MRSENETQRPDPVLLDDGAYYVTYQAGAATGFLLRRCDAPEGFECVGGFSHDPAQGSWYAAITTTYDEERDRDHRVVGDGSRLDAIGALWRHRHEALTKYPAR
ncbi:MULTISPECIES: hypothetical protein [Burkholderiaceae]|uniref:hypothetical protein n=1 Tax=Burkholderiaceae TaxID=119060 RepID=UPI000D009DC6|nr:MULTISPECIES: hypothetical protein [Burkholderiaceae]MBR8042081.1 hypothetical protein [Burkholderia cenocepacia]MBU7436100.1 hypothetical protein [Paraburkholderia fungorum]PRE81309.1 hypothetical protein C6Q13_24975 [Burkholderia gladioli]HDR9491926.1 hypothetical protein [Burkholderia stabilis]HDR9524040.1 hypothetical protein [Burkholderia stabilis]